MKCFTYSNCSGTRHQAVAESEDYSLHILLCNDCCMNLLSYEKKLLFWYSYERQDRWKRESESECMQ